MEMTFYGLVLLTVSHLSHALPAPVDAVIVQVQQRVAASAHEVTEQVLLNGVYLTGTSQEAEGILQRISADFSPLLLLSSNNSSILKNLTIVRSRECILEGTRLHWADRVFVDSQIFLTLDHNGAWTAYVPQAVPLKTLWDETITRTERLELQEGCIRLMRELSLSQKHPVSENNLPQLLIPMLAFLAFIGLIAISLLISKTHGLRQPGGVIGSVIHYPKDIGEMPLETKGGYRTL